MGPSPAAGRRAALLVICALCVARLAPVAHGARPLTLLGLERDERAAGYGRENRVRIVRIAYVASDGATRRAYVLLPRWYGPHDDPPLPLVISPHGRGVPALANVSLWGNLPAIGRFAVVCPEGQGRRLTLYAWGWQGDIADLARMPAIVRHALPYVRLDRRRVYVFGSSMGGQEALLLVARDPRLLAGAAAFDADTNLAVRYHMIAALTLGRSLQRKMRVEVGGSPASAAAAYRLRSPLFDARAIAFARVPLQIWWSRRDRIVRDQQLESGLLYRRITRLNPRAPVVQVVGTWAHSAEFRATRRLALALSAFALLPVRERSRLSLRSRRALGLPRAWPGPVLALGLETPRETTRRPVGEGEAVGRGLSG